ncbi:hypothetical protein, variant [Verruconis gallopava]|uniref:TPR-like protein n=1 Tax=Verruconis gallopava TaxID=253628 RepID=A0A0D2A876_9PEZI|nr:hypothetical protein, variant [Verruconis gallopava]KIW02795.1 hypothetical protein, variant [Verruconis gallopava]
MAAEYGRFANDDVGSDDENPSPYPAPSSSYPYFQTSDPALRAAYAYGDPSGGYQYPDPTALYGVSLAPSSPLGNREVVEEGSEESAEDVFNEDESIQRDLAIAQVAADLTNAENDPDYESPVDLNEQDSQSDENIDFIDTESRTRRRGRGGRGRGSRGRPRGRGRGSSFISRASPARNRGNARGLGRGRVAEDGRRGGSQGRKYGPRAMAEPTAEFKNYNALMNKAYIAEDYDEALRQGLEAVKVNPEMFHVHATIAEILLRKGRKDDALGALYVGVHATRDEGSWWYVIEKLIELGGNSKETRQRLQDCYSSLLDMDPDNYKARYGRMKNYMASGQKTRARNECLNLLHRNPLDVDTLQVLAEICFSIEEPAIAAPSFGTFFELSVAQGGSDDVELAWKLLDIYMDILVHCSEWETGLHKLRTLARWILNRADEEFWDACDDDREWDLDDEPRRVEVEKFTPGRYPLETYGEGLPIELRAKMGLLRLGMGSKYHAEALDHFEYFEPEDDSPDAYVYEYPDLFREIGDALREEELHQDALRFYEPIQRQTQSIDSRFYFDIAICYQALGREEEVKRTMEALRLFKRGARDANFYVGLAKLYQSQGREKDMQYLVRQLRRMGKSDLVLAAGLPLPRGTTRAERGQTVADDDQSESGDDISHEGSDFRPLRARSGRVRKDKRLERQKFREGVVRNLYDQLLELSKGLADQDPDAVTDWTNLADQLMDEFKTEKLFFPRERATKFTGFERWQRTVTVPEGDAVFRESPDSEKEVPQFYCNIHFDEWLDVLLQLALQHARNGQKDLCWDVMKTVQSANIFLHEPERMQKKRNVSLGKLFAGMVVRRRMQLIHIQPAL